MNVACGSAAPGFPGTSPCCSQWGTNAQESSFHSLRTAQSVVSNLLRAAFILPAAVLSGGPLRKQTLIVMASVHTPNV